MQFKPLVDIVNRLRLLLSPSIADYKIKPSMGDNGIVVFIEVKPSQIKRVEAILPKKMDAIDIIVVSSVT